MILLEEIRCFLVLEGADWHIPCAWEYIFFENKNLLKFEFGKAQQNVVPFKGPYIEFVSSVMLCGRMLNIVNHF